jgi:CRISPR/Cas system-associated endonuclease Cas1
MRPVVDRAVLQLIETATFTNADFSTQHLALIRKKQKNAAHGQHNLDTCD